MGRNRIPAGWSPVGSPAGRTAFVDKKVSQGRALRSLVRESLDRELFNVAELVEQGRHDAGEPGAGEPDRRAGLCPQRRGTRPRGWRWNGHGD